MEHGFNRDVLLADMCIEMDASVRKGSEACGSNCTNIY